MQWSKLAAAGGLILRICTSYDVFLHKQLPFAGRGDCTCINILVALIILKSQLIS